MNNYPTTSESDFNKFTKYVWGLLNRNWCGKLEISFFKGKVEWIKEKQIRKLEEL